MRSHTGEIRFLIFLSFCLDVFAAGGHIPYRDSKLTRILQPSLGGNAKTAIICNITPAALHQEESHSTLRFACRAKRVVNNAMVNEVVSDAAVLKRQAKEIEELRKVLAANGYASLLSVENTTFLVAQKKKYILSIQRVLTWLPKMLVTTEKQTVSRETSLFFCVLT